MQFTIATSLEKSLDALLLFDRKEEQDVFNKWIVEYPAQIVNLAMQVDWSNRVEESLRDKQGRTLQFEQDLTI
jgi:hypothetical protein